MNKSGSFWISLEEYSHKVIGRSPLPQYWPWAWVTCVVLIILVSIYGGRMSVAGETSLEGVIKRAAQIGDYPTARELLNRRTSSAKKGVLGADSELEEKVNPESKVERRIRELEDKLMIYPENKEIYLMLAELYGQLENWELASEYREKARVLDPNGAEFR